MKKIKPYQIQIDSSQTANSSCIPSCISKKLQGHNFLQIFLQIGIISELREKLSTKIYFDLKKRFGTLLHIARLWQTFNSDVEEESVLTKFAIKYPSLFLTCECFKG